MRNLSENIFVVELLSAFCLFSLYMWRYDVIILMLNIKFTVVCVTGTERVRNSFLFN